MSDVYPDFIPDDDTYAHYLEALHQDGEEYLQRLLDDYRAIAEAGDDMKTRAHELVLTITRVLLERKMGLV